MKALLISDDQSDSSTAAAVESAMKKIEEIVPPNLLKSFRTELLPQGIQDLLYATDENQDIPHALQTLFMNPENRQIVILLLRTTGHSDLAGILASKGSETLDGETTQAIIDAFSNCTSGEGVEGTLSQLQEMHANAINGNTTDKNVRHFREILQTVFGDTTVRNEQAHVGRNQACPCGSGKKYKKCCGGKK